jgi:hypothetical protein
MVPIWGGGVPAVAQPVQHRTQRVQAVDGVRRWICHDLEHAELAGPVSSPERGPGLPAAGRPQHDQIKAGLPSKDTPELGGRPPLGPTGHMSLSARPTSMKTR